jgi:hypothetical protein
VLKDQDAFLLLYLGTLLTCMWMSVSFLNLFGMFSFFILTVNAINNQHMKDTLYRIFIEKRYW